MTAQNQLQGGMHHHHAAFHGDQGRALPSNFQHNFY